MKTEYLDELYPYQLREKLSNMGVELTDDQYRILADSGRTFLYAHRIGKRKGSVIYRITYPLFLVWNLFVTLIIQPIKWILTGDFYFNTDNKLYKFTIKWGRKIGL
jgi:hypothetical protein